MLLGFLGNPGVVESSVEGGKANQPEITGLGGKTWRQLTPYTLELC
jgi:hypothetical protein